MEGENVVDSSPPPSDSDQVTFVAGNVNTGGGDFVGRDKIIQADKVDAHNSIGFVNRPIGPVNQYYGNTINTGNSDILLTKNVKYILFGTICIIIILILFIYRQWNPPFEPMREGWNLLIPGIAFSGIKGSNEAGEALSDRLVTKLQKHFDNVLGVGKPQVGFITGSPDERVAEAARLAELHHADVVLYGVITPTTPGRANFTPEFYVRIGVEIGGAPATELDYVSGSELYGAETFGEAIDFSLHGDMINTEIISRTTVLIQFLEALRSYIEHTESSLTEANQRLDAIFGTVKSLGCDSNELKELSGQHQLFRGSRRGLWEKIKLGRTLLFAKGMKVIPVAVFCDGA